MSLSRQLDDVPIEEAGKRTRYMSAGVTNRQERRSTSRYTGKLLVAIGVRAKAQSSNSNGPIPGPYYRKGKCWTRTTMSV